VTKHTGSVINDEQRAKRTYVFCTFLTVFCVLQHEKEKVSADRDMHSGVGLSGSLQVGRRQKKMHSWACINSSGGSILV